MRHTQWITRALLMRDGLGRFMRVNEAVARATQSRARRAVIARMPVQLALF